MDLKYSLVVLIQSSTYSLETITMLLDIFTENSKVVGLVLLDLPYILVPKRPADFTIRRHEYRDTDLWGAQDD